VQEVFMADDNNGFTRLGVLHPNNVLKVNERPLQSPSGPRLVRTATVGGPELAGDRRFYLSSDLLAKLLDVARSSPMGRVEVQRAGLRVDLYVDGNGHEYEVWTIIGADPKPERLPAGLDSLVRG
jgi:hypothetical protein